MTILPLRLLCRMRVTPQMSVRVQDARSLFTLAQHFTNGGYHYMVPINTNFVETPVFFDAADPDNLFVKRFRARNWNRSATHTHTDG